MAKGGEPTRAPLPGQSKAEQSNAESGARKGAPALSRTYSGPFDPANLGGCNLDAGGAAYGSRVQIGNQFVPPPIRLHTRRRRKARRAFPTKAGKVRATTLPR